MGGCLILGWCPHQTSDSQGLLVDQQQQGPEQQQQGPEQQQQGPDQQQPPTDASTEKFVGRFRLETYSPESQPIAIEHPLPVCDASFTNNTLVTH